MREGLCDKCNSPLFVRTDDQPETIRERLRVFHEQSKPIEAYFEARGLLRCVNGGDNPEHTYCEIIASDPRECP
jgi:adenylate kinase